MSAMHGGKRNGAGRKAGAKTATVRVPENGAPVARELAEMIVAYAQQSIELTTWYKSAPERLKADRPDIKLVGIEHRRHQDRDIRAVVACVTVGEYRATFFADLFGFNQWPAVASEAVIEAEE